MKGKGGTLDWSIARELVPRLIGRQAGWWTAHRTQDLEITSGPNVKVSKKEPCDVATRLVNPALHYGHVLSSGEHSMKTSKR